MEPIDIQDPILALRTEADPLNQMKQYPCVQVCSKNQLKRGRREGGDPEVNTVASEEVGPILGVPEVSLEGNSYSMIGASEEGGVSWVEGQMAEPERILESERVEAWREDSFL